MKAFILWEKDYDEKGQVVVFADTSVKAKKQVYSTDLDPDEYIDVRVKRAPEFDDMEGLKERELALAQWKEGWYWYDYPDMPDYEESNEEEFIEFYNRHFAAPYELKEGGGRYTAVFTKKAQPDFTGTLKGGKSIVFEAKHTDGTNIPFDRINDVQERDLSYHRHLGAVTYIVISFGMKHFYAVPWSVWKELNENSGKKSVNQTDLAEFEISTTNGYLELVKEEEG